MSARVPAIRCVGVTKEYGRGDTAVHALRGVDLDVPPGTLAMLFGPSGCGKTTLISVLAGILDMTAGNVEIFGTAPFQLSDAARTEWRSRDVGFVFQQYNLLPSLTAVENAAVSLMIRGVDWNAATRRARPLLEELGLGDRADARPRELSGGQQQRVAIARALLHEPRLIVCDEPTSALDHATGEKVVELLRSIAVREGRAVLVVTHDDRIRRYADLALHMDDGRIVERAARASNGASADPTDAH
ncbi:MAG: ABC transporter ATP-binding protein [Phycisphaerae bacterium]|nr:ABC transporter ATP-binding protein [Phycisphaerae bacterium]